MQAVPVPTTVPGVSVATPRGADDGEAKGDAAVEAYARDHEGLTPEDERDALDFVLAPKAPRLYDVIVQYETEAGTRPLTFVVRGMDGRKLDEIEMRHISEATGRIDQISADLEVVNEGTVFLQGRKGHETKLTSDEFLTIVKPKKVASDPDENLKLGSPVDALEARFKTQLGLLSGVARQIRTVSGYDPNRVSAANRRVVTAVGNS